MATTGGRQLTRAALATRETAPVEGALNRKELASVARDAMKALKMRPSLRLVLAELVGCWGEVKIKDRILIWPSNDYIATRTGLSERAIRYGIRGLGDLQVIATKDSANGKRFAIKGAGGNVIDVFGFDLTALYARRAEFRAAVEEQEAEYQQRRRLFDEITICRRSSEEALLAIAKEHPELDVVDLSADLDAAKSHTPRRSTPVPIGSLNSILENWQRISRIAERRYFEAGNGGKECRLIESNNGTYSNIDAKQPPKKAEDREFSTPLPAFLSLRLIIQACPEFVSLYPRPIESDNDLIDTGRYLRGSLGAHESAWDEAVGSIGPVRAATLVAITLQLQAEDVKRGTTRIRNPGGYFRSLVRLTRAGKFDIERELMALRRKQLE